jgi:hypothetical protein
MSASTPGAPAISIDTICENLSHHGLSDRDTRALPDDENFQGLAWRCHQLYYVELWARTELGKPFIIASLQRAFQCLRSPPKSALANGFDPRKERRRHLAFDDRSEADILAWIQRKYEKNTRVSRTDVSHYCALKCKIEITKGWVDSCTGRHLAELAETKSMPQEEPRRQVPRVFLNATRYAMQEAVHSRPADLVFNSGEVGISECEDRKPKKVIVPITAEPPSVHHAISRNLKHRSVIACISAGGQCLFPSMVTSQDSAPVRNALATTGLPIASQLI